MPFLIIILDFHSAPRDPFFFVPHLLLRHFSPLSPHLWPQTFPLAFAPALSNRGVLCLTHMLLLSLSHHHGYPQNKTQLRAYPILIHVLTPCTFIQHSCFTALRIINRASNRIQTSRRPNRDGGSGGPGGNGKRYPPVPSYEQAPQPPREAAQRAHQTASGCRALNSSSGRSTAYTLRNK